MGTSTEGWASNSDWQICRNLRRQHDAKLFLVDPFFSSGYRRRIDAVWSFVHVATASTRHPKFDEGDHRSNLSRLQSELRAAINGRRPGHPVLRAFVDVARECGMALNEPFLFLESVGAALSTPRYPRYEDLERHLRGSAGSVGLMLSDVLGVSRTPSITDGAMAMAEAIQFTNMLRDIGRDLTRGHIFLPIEDMDRFGVVEEDLYNQRVSSEFVQLMQYEALRARRLFEEASRALPELPPQVRRPARLVGALSIRSLNQLARLNYDVFRKPPTASSDSALTSLQMLWGQ